MNLGGNLDVNLGERPTILLHVARFPLR